MRTYTGAILSSAIVRSLSMGQRTQNHTRVKILGLIFLDPRLGFFQLQQFRLTPTVVHLMKSGGLLQGGIHLELQVFPPYSRARLFSGFQGRNQTRSVCSARGRLICQTPKWMFSSHGYCVMDAALPLSH